MASLSVSDFNKLKAFLKALQDIKFSATKPIPSTVRIKGQIIPVDKTHCFEILRSFGGLQGKNDSEIINFLGKPGNRGGILGSELTRIQQIELIQALADQPTVEGQLTPQTGSAEQVVAVGAVAETKSSKPFSMPSTPPVPQYRSIPQTPSPEKVPPSFEATEPIKTEMPEYMKKDFPVDSAKINPDIKPQPANSQDTPQKEQNIRNQRFNLPTFNMPSSVKTLGSNAQILTKKGLIRGGRGLAGMIKTGLESANPFLGRMGNGLIGGLTNIANPGGIGGGSGSIFGKLGRLGRTGSSTSSVISKAGSGKKWALIGILGFILLLGVVSLPSSSSTTPSPSSPPTTSTDISNCLFTRGAENPSAVKFQSSSLLSYIQEAANKSTIPPAVLAAFVRVESPSSSGMSDEQITAYTCIYSGPGKNVSETGALGIMQIQPPGTTSLIGDPASCDDCIDAGARLIGKTLSTMTEADYCNPRTGIIVGAGWILKKMSYLGLGDGTKWDPAWTNDTKAITALVNTYYGDILYPDVNTGPYNYATDVQTSIQNCQVSAPGNVPPPPTDGNYQKWLEEFGVKIASGFVPEVYQWAYEALAPTASVAPKFQGLLDLPANPVEVIPICNHVSYTSGRTIYLRNRTAFCITVVAGTPEGPTSNPDLFRHTLTHELGHVLYNTDRTTYNAKIIQARINDNGFLTAYSQNAASSEFLACGAGDDNGNRADEDFAESVSYFINRGIVTQDYGCGIWSEELGVNPYDLQINDQMKYAAHYQFMTELLK